MAQDESVEELLRKLHEAMKKQGTQAKEFKVGTEVLKISLQPEPAHHPLLSDNSETSAEKSSQIEKDCDVVQASAPSLKKISLSAIHLPEDDAPNECYRNFLQNEWQESYRNEDSEGSPIIKPTDTLDDLSDHIGFLLTNHPESKDHIEAVKTKLEEVETENKERKKVEEQLSNILSESMSTSLNIFDSESTLLSLSKIRDPLCRLVSAHLKNLSNGNIKQANENPSFLFLYSQPLVNITPQGSVVPLFSQIDYEKEQQNIRKVLRDCKVGYIRECATVEKIGNWLQSGVQIVHFCGHGIKGTINHDLDFLVFEDQNGKAQFVGEEVISQILKKLKKPLQFVFVASCHSKILGDVFFKAGVPHVICVRREERILDEACQQFVRLFYHSCLNNSMSICESFDFAKLQLSLLDFPKGEEHKFVILRKEDPVKDHQCSVLNTAKIGAFKDLTKKSIYGKNIPSRVENFIFRHEIMYEVISTLAKQRFVTIKGMPGIGKSTLVRQLTRHIHFRGNFKDGVLYTQLSGCQTVDSLFQSLLYEMSDGVRASKGSFEDSLQNIAGELSNRHVLIVIDNCDTLLLSNDRMRFKQIIESLLRRCHHTHLLFSNRTRIGELLHSYELEYCTERVFNLERLSVQDSHNLFLSRAPRQLSEQEVNELLRLEKVTDLKQHPLFDFLNGHPQAISLSTALLADRSLKEVYQLLMNQSLADEFGMKHDEKRGYNAFRISLEVSWNIIKKREPDAALMFRIMGLLPAGLDSQMMSRIFGGRWRQAIKVLNKYSLIKKTERLGASYYCIHPFMISYAEALVEPEEKRRYHEKITEQMARRIFDRVYKNVGTLSSYAQKAAELYLIEQVNFKACIYREYSFFGDNHKLKSFYKNLFNHVEQSPSDDEASEGERRDTDTNSLRSSTSSTSRFMVDGPQIYRKFRDDLSSDDDGKAGEDRQKFARTEKQQKEIDYKYKRKDPPAILRLMLYQATVLFVVKNFSACQRIIAWGLELSSKLKSSVSQANFYRILACMALIKKEETKARDLFSRALQIFAMIGCGLGTASCQSALGYIRYLEEEYAQAKKNLESALKYYEQIPHIFGKHYLNRWLYNIKTKINREKNELQSHNEEARKLIKQAKAALKGNKIDNFLNKHKAGCFVFRFMFDNISLFLECSFEIDVKPKKIPLFNPKQQQNILKNIALGDNRKVAIDSELMPISQDEERSMLEIKEDWSDSDIDKIEIREQADEMLEHYYIIEKNLLEEQKQSKKKLSTIEQKPRTGVTKPKSREPREMWKNSTVITTDKRPKKEQGLNVKPTIVMTTKNVATTQPTLVSQRSRTNSTSTLSKKK